MTVCLTPRADDADHHVAPGPAATGPARRPRRTRAARIALGLLGVAAALGASGAGTARAGATATTATATTATGATAAPAVGSQVGGGVAPATSNPPKSIAPSTQFVSYCFIPGHPALCNHYAVADIDVGRKAEGLPKLTLPASFWTASTRQQLRLVTDAERSARHLPTFPDSPVLDTLAQLGAQAGVDPTGPIAFTWGSNLAWGYATPLAADFGWMYDDGPNSPNVDCTPRDTRGCWGHRDNILAPWRGAQGVGVTESGGMITMSQLFVQGF